MSGLVADPKGTTSTTIENRSQRPSIRHREFEIHSDIGSATGLKCNFFNECSMSDLEPRKQDAEPISERNTLYKKEADQAAWIPSRRRSKQSQVPRLFDEKKECENSSRRIIFRKTKEASKLTKPSQQDINQETMIEALAVRRFVKRNNQQHKAQSNDGLFNADINFEQDEYFMQPSQPQEGVNAETAPQLNDEPNKPADEDSDDIHIGEAEMCNESSGTDPTSELETIPIQIRMSDIGDLRKFLTTTVSKGQVLQCTIRRHNSGFNIFRPQYNLHFSENLSFLMSAKNKDGSGSYYISAAADDFDYAGPNYLGHVQKKENATIYTLFDDGFSPKKPISGIHQRQIIGSVHFESNSFGVKGPRRIHVYVPNPSQKRVPSEDETDLKECFEKLSRDFFCELTNRPPRWNTTLKAYVLNFRGRVDKPSVKNFILEDRRLGDNAREVLLFGRVGSDVFNLDVAYPLSPLQAFQIAVTSFDYKVIGE